MTILDQIAEATRERVMLAKTQLPLMEIKQQAFSLPKGTFSFEEALKKPSISFICECKKASPSKGIIAKDFPYVQIAKEYEEAGADCISVLTEPQWFLGQGQYLKEISEAVSIPCLRKDFVVDEYMIYEAKLLGASAVLLICAILTTEEIKEYIKICDKLGISALVEAHNEEEIKSAIAAGARIIGVNNRNLKDFSVNITHSRTLREYVPNDILFVAESGIHNREEIANLRDAGVDAVLVGEALMKAENKTEKLQELKGCL